MCMKYIRKVFSQGTKYAILLLVCASTAAITTLITQRALLARDRDVSPRDRSEIRVIQDALVVSSVPENKLYMNAVITESIPSSTKTSNMTRENGEASNIGQHVVLKSDHKLTNEPVTQAETDEELLSKYNVKPNSKWLRTFYRIDDAAPKRKSLFDFPFIINGSDICNGSRDPFLVIIVVSLHTHIDTREAIRNTWGRAANPGVWPKVGALKEKVKLVFLFGRGQTDLKNEIVRDESHTYHDVVQADFVDSYFNLTYKVITGIRWVSEFCPGAKYILKADEDVFVHVFNLINMLKKEPDTGVPMFYGHTQDRSSVRRTGRWEVAPRAFPFPVYPSYTCGNTYVIPVSKATEVYKMAGYLDYLNIEDVFLTGILRTLIGAGVQDVIGFTNWSEKKPIPCEFKNSVRISATRVTVYLQYDIWKGLRNDIENCYESVGKNESIVQPENVVQYEPAIQDQRMYLQDK